MVNYNIAPQAIKLIYMYNKFLILIKDRGQKLNCITETVASRLQPLALKDICMYCLLYLYVIEHSFGISLCNINLNEDLELISN